MDGPSRTHKILIIEDEAEILNMMREALVAEGFPVDTATSAQEGHAKILQYQPDLVLTDNDMPGLSGLELLRDLRRQLNYVAVIFVSGRRDVAAVTQALKSGADDYIRKPFSFEELIARVEACLRTHDLHQELKQANQQLQDMVDRDHLTGLLNMRSMYDRIDGELRRAQRHGRKLAAVMVDMDHFKSVNDTNDHLFGSFVLKETGRIIAQSMRISDFAARYGGDEFLIVLTETDQQGAQVFCERLRQRIEEQNFTDGKSSIRLTISLGCAVSDGKNMEARTLVRQADHALYRAKEGGRNRVELVGA